MKSQLNSFIAANPRYDEIALFREISNYLSRRYRCLFIDETHQQYVEFDSTVTRCRKRRELSDLWIISFSNRKKKIKMTFLQAKLVKNQTPISIPFKYSCDYFQYDLLAFRPNITNYNRFNFPTTILSNAIYDSVGTYGIFYNDSFGNLDFAFSTASDITYKTVPICTTKNRTFRFKNIDYGNAEYRFHGISNDLELRTTLNADYFESALLNMFVGTPIENDPIIKSFLLNFLSSFSSNPIILNFISLLTELGEISGSDLFEFKGNPRILIINVDRDE